MAQEMPHSEDDYQHGLDNNPHNDAEKGAVLGGLSGAVAGAVAGSVVGPVGTVLGSVAGGLLGAGASGLAVAAVDEYDNDRSVTGVQVENDPNINAGLPVGSGPDGISLDDNIRQSSDGPVTGTPVGGHNIVTGEAATTNAGNAGLAAGAVVGGAVGALAGGPVGAVLGGVAGSLMGGVAGDATEATDDAAALGEQTNPLSRENSGDDSIETRDTRTADLPHPNAVEVTGGTDANADVPGGGDPDVPGVSRQPKTGWPVIPPE